MKEAFNFKHFPANKGGLKYGDFADHNNDYRACRPDRSIRDRDFLVPDYASCRPLFNGYH